MADCDTWLRRFQNWKRHGSSDDKAPHKPLMLLTLLQLAEQDELPADEVELTPELAFRFSVLATIVAHRRSSRVDIRYPFHHLSTDACWRVLTASREESADSSQTHYALFNPEFRSALGDMRCRHRMIRFLVESYFPADEQPILYEIMGLSAPADLGVGAPQVPPIDAEGKGREARFRLCIVAAYGYQCALSGYRLTTVSGASIVDAAHIHQFSDSRNNDPDNGIALSKNAHWLFDHGLWTLDDNYRVLVATGHFTEASPDQRALAEYHGQPIRLPRDERFWPNRQHLAWHRRNRFLAG